MKIKTILIFSLIFTAFNLSFLATEKSYAYNYGGSEGNVCGNRQPSGSGGGGGVMHTFTPSSGGGPKTCTNGATNYPACNTCAIGSTFTNNSCVCNNGANNSPSCNSCPSGTSLNNNLCTCRNGATNPNACNICPVGSSMQNNQCICGNGATPDSSCFSCPAGKIMNSNICVTSCSLTNVCGQTQTGYINSGNCSTLDGSNPNNTCITSFNMSTNNVNPNGSVEFSWTLGNLSKNVGAKCGFVDLTTPTPRPIPGLQNLDQSIDRIRIKNIQTTTRFCLVCQFYNLINNANLGEAAQHQWIRVIRIGEN